MCFIIKRCPACWNILRWLERNFFTYVILIWHQSGMVRHFSLHFLWRILPLLFAAQIHGRGHFEFGIVRWRASGKSWYNICENYSPRYSILTVRWAHDMQLRQDLRQNWLIVKNEITGIFEGQFWFPIFIKKTCHTGERPRILIL